MFTGRIRQVGTIAEIDDRALRIDAPKLDALCEPGGALAVNGVSFTVSVVAEEGIAAALSPETRRRSTFGSLRVGTRVNLEPAVEVGSALDGHLVQGT